MARAWANTKRKPIAAIMAALLLSACATQPKNELSFDEKYALLQSEHKYGAAERLLLSTTTLAAQQRDTLSEQLSEQRESFEQETATEAQQLRDDNKWGDAIALIQTALQNFPESLFLRKQLQTLFNARDEYVRTLQLRFYQDRANALRKEITTIESLSDALREDEGKQQLLTRLYQEREETALALMQEGQRRLALNEPKTAHRYLTLSQQLVADERTETALRLASKKMQPRKQRTRVAQKAKPKPPSDFELAMTAYEAALEKNELRTALREIRKAAKLQPDNASVQQKKADLGERIDSIVEAAVEEGKYHYSLGDIDTAIERWQMAVALAPYDDALKERLAKAKRFQQRYEELKE